MSLYYHHHQAIFVDDVQRYVTAQVFVSEQFVFVFKLKPVSFVKVIY